MKKTALVLALGAAFAGAAMAQSNVTLYGRVNTSIERDAQDGSHRNGLAYRNNNSRLGVRGVEDLGGGTRALFGIETQFDSDSGVNGLGGQLRSSYVGLQSGVGTVVIGRLDPSVPNRAGSPLYSQWGRAWNDVNHDTGTTFMTTFATTSRASNAIGYASPVWGGFDITARYALLGPENTTTTLNPNFATPPVSANNSLESDIRALQIAGTYAKGPLVAGLGLEFRSYNDGNANNGTVPAAGSNGNNDIYGIAANRNQFKNRIQGVFGYDAKVVKVGAILARNSYDNAFGNGSASAPTINNSRKKQTEFGVSVAVPLGKHALVANYGQQQVQNGTTIDNDAGGPAVAYNTGLGQRRVWQLGYHYNLSARSRVYAFYQSLDNNTAANDKVTLTTGQVTAMDSTRINTFGIGMRHNF
ncbi:porin [Parvibium lacunae]|uniref:Porin n=1 Tax=Parvibium lacunae TaxID=1888893 RepID=A0A368L5X9_9BURK|nr:porin [Parvibium lacunae]RCS58550.1 porin [Parvibium lacunae]